MLTDDQARTLLHAAADTIEVTPARPIQLPPPRPAWVPGLAIAAVLIVIAGTLSIVFARGSDHAADRISPIGPPSSTTQSWPAPSDPDLFRVAPDQMPSLFGYTAAAATALLEEHGFKVKVRHLPECGSDGRVFDSLPTVGSMLSRGERITIDVGSYREDPSCSGESVTAMGATPVSVSARQHRLVYGFLDWIDGRGPAPEFGANVSVQIGDTTTSLSRSAASLLASWGDDLDQVRDATREIWVEPSLQSYPYLTPQLDLGAASTSGLSGYPTATTWLMATIAPTYWTFSGLANVDLFLDADQRIVGVQVDKLSQSTAPAEPQVVGDPAAFAKKRLKRNLYAVTLRGCGGNAIVTRERRAARPRSARGPVSIVLTCKG
jgi:hypothetical protein